MVGKEPAAALVLEHKESVERLRAAILDLREEEKEVFLLRQNGDLTYEQIAELRHCPVGKGRKMTYQRFDFVVRVRELADKEKQTMEAKLKKSDRLTDHRIAILFALKGLTGKEAGPTAKEWRKALAMEKK